MNNLSEFLRVPFLPDRKVSHVLVAADCYEELNPVFERLGIKAVPSPYSKSLPLYIRYHPDMNCRHLGRNRFAVFKDAENLSPLLSLGAELVFTDPPVNPCYPYDASLNYLPFGNRLICNPVIADKNSLGYLSVNEIICVKQGYCACSVSVLNESLVITGDAGISRELAKHNVGVINANAEKIVLKGCGNGFIGGASGLISPNTVCFTGRTDGVIDTDELSAVGFHCIVLSDLPMYDIGGIVPVMQVSK